VKCIILYRGVSAPIFLMREYKIGIDDHLSQIKCTAVTRTHSTK
jgi:hypothetical protein